MQDDEKTWNVRGTPAPVRRRPPQADDPAGITLTGIDVPFVQLTFFFIKASLSMALALTLTSAIWVAVGGLLAGITVGGWLALTAVFGPYGGPVAPGTAPAVVAAPAPPPPPPELPPAPDEPIPDEDPVIAAKQAPASKAAAQERPPTKNEVEASDAATEAILRAELEAMRQRKGR